MIPRNDDFRVFRLSVDGEIREIYSRSIADALSVCLPANFRRHRDPLPEIGIEGIYCPVDF